MKLDICFCVLFQLEFLICGRGRVEQKTKWVIWNFLWHLDTNRRNITHLDQGRMENTCAFWINFDLIQVLIPASMSDTNQFAERLLC